MTEAPPKTGGQRYLSDFTSDKIKVIALDLDMTLLRSDRSLSSRSLDVLNRCQAMGKRIVIATSRPRFSVAAVIPTDLGQAVWICQNGAEIYEGGERIFQSCLPHPSTEKIIRWLGANHPSVELSVQVGDALFCSRPLYGTGPAWTHQVVDIASLIGQPMTKIIVDLRDLPDHSHLLKIVPDDCRLIVTDGGTLGQIMDASVSKAQAMRMLLQHWRLGLENVIAFGDDVVDIDLIKESGIGVAMGNAVPEVKAVADLVAKSNDDDGVAEILEKLVLGSV